jgi:hypothetical protein
MESGSKGFSKDEQLKPSMDFNYLKNEGLEYIQKLSGGIWTDYNDHDPGVTILEQLCYALTDLAYRTDYEVEKLLVDAKTEEIDGKKNAFYSPRMIFSRHPVTIIDFRKLIIDRYNEVQNVWIYPKRVYQREECLSGIYEMVIMPSLEFEKKRGVAKEREDEFIKDLNLFLAENRNIGEECSNVILLKPKNIQLNVNIQINENADPEAIMSEVLFNLEVFLYQPVAISSLNEMVKEKLSLEEIFSGPRLEFGFIKDENLKDRNNIINIDQIKRLLSKIIGVEHVMEIVLNSNPDLKELKVNDIEYFKLNFDPLKGVFETIKIFVNNSPIKLNRTKTSNKLFDFWSKSFRSYKMGKFLEESYTDKLKGEFRNQGKYTSIQHHFPLIYGLGKDGVSSNESNERKATVKQLRAYLLFFEQHLANHLAQLSNLDSLFDVNYPKKEITYYSQPLTNKNNKSDFEKLKEVLAIDFDGEEVEKALRFETKEIFLDRKNRLFDHLLARFGENIDELPFLISLNLNLISDQIKFKEELLKRKSAFLIALEYINYFQNKGENFKKVQDVSDLSGLEQILLTKTGIRQISKPLKFEHYGINKKINPSDYSIIEEKANFQDFDQKFRNLSEDEKLVIELEPAFEEDFLPYFGKIGLKWVLRKGLDFQNYRISNTQNINESVKVIFQKKEKKWITLIEGISEQEGINFINRLVSKFREINVKSEGLYVVDHILLRSLLISNKIGFFILNEFDQKIWQSKWVGTEEERKELLNDFYQSAKDRNNYKFENGFLKLISSDGKKVLANYIQGNQETPLSENEVDEIWESNRSLALLMSGKEEELGRLALDEIEGFRLKGTLKGKPLNQRRVIMNSKIADLDDADGDFGEDFFDQKVSIVLPDWPARFQVKNFRSYIENLVSERIPVHIEATVYWLDFEEFKNFETLCIAWRDAKINNNQDLKVHSLELAKELKTFKSRREVQ